MFFGKNFSYLLIRTYSMRFYGNSNELASKVLLLKAFSGTKKSNLVKSDTQLGLQYVCLLPLMEDRLFLDNLFVAGICLKVGNL